MALVSRPKAGHFAATTNAELTTVYNNVGNQLNLNDITKGSCGYYMQDSAAKG